MGFASTLLGLPEKLLLAIFAFAALFFVSLVSSWFPGFGNWFWGVGLIVAAVFLKDIVIVRGKRFDLSAGSIAAMLGIGILVFNILAVNLPSFSVSVLSIVSPATAQSIVLPGGTVIDVDLTTVVVATVGCTVGAIIGQEYIFRKKKKRR